MEKIHLQFDLDDTTGQIRHDRIYQAQMIRQRAQLLETREKELIEAVFEHSSTFEQIARLTGQNASSISRRFRKLTQKLIGHECILLLQGDAQFSTLELSIGREYFIHDVSQQKISRKLGCSEYYVRKVIKKMRVHLSKSSYERVER